MLQMSNPRGEGDSFRGYTIVPFRRKLLRETPVKCGEEVPVKMLRCCKILERMVNQNSCVEIAQGSPLTPNPKRCNTTAQILSFTRIPRTSSRTWRGLCCPCGSLSTPTTSTSWRSRPSAGVLATPTCLLLASAHVRPAETVLTLTLLTRRFLPAAQCRPGLCVLPEESFLPRVCLRG